MTSKPNGSLISHFSNLVKTRGGINLAQGIPGFQPPSELTHALAATAKGNAHQYAPGIGNTKLVNHLANAYNVSTSNLLIVQGATEGISLAYTLALKKFGQNICSLSFSPAYESYTRLPEIFGQRHINLPLHEGSIEFDSLTETLRKEPVRIIFVASPGNPYGRVVSSHEMERLIELANSYNFLLVIDMVYRQLYFDNQPYLPQPGQPDNVVYVNSFSKSLCITGWRIGYVIAEAGIMSELRAIHDYIGLCAPSVLQEALSMYLEENDSGKKFISIFRNKLKRNFKMVENHLKSIGFKIPKTDGGCFVWAQLPDGIFHGFDFAQELYNQYGIALIPGEHFDAQYVNWVRINIARETSEVERGLAGIENFICEKPA